MPHDSLGVCYIQELCLSLLAEVIIVYCDPCKPVERNRLLLILVFIDDAQVSDVHEHGQRSFVVVQIGREVLKQHIEL